jgi:hypothetical protein
MAFQSRFLEILTFENEAQCASSLRFTQQNENSFCVFFAVGKKQKKRTLAFGFNRSSNAHTLHYDSTHRPSVVHFAFEVSPKVRRAARALESGVLRSIEPHCARFRRKLRTRGFLIHTWRR